MTETIAKTIRVAAEQWKRIEKLAADRNVSANQLLVELAMEALDRREWPRNDAEIHVARATMFVSLALQHDLIAAGREDEVEELQRLISTVLPEPATEPQPPEPSEARDRRPLIADPRSFLPEHAGQLECIFRGVYLLSTIRRDEMLRDGQREEFERIHNDAYRAQDSIRDQARSLQKTEE